MLRTLTLAIAILFSHQALGGPVAPRPGWQVQGTGKPYQQLLTDLRAAVKANGMAVVTEAGPTEVARSRGITIPGNRVLGVYNNKFAVRAIGLSVAAMIEAPIRFYVTEDAGGTATLSYKMPSHVFAPYFDEGGDGLKALAAELDQIFARIAAAAVK